MIASSRPVKETDLLRVFKGKPDDRTDLVVINPVDQSRHQNDLNACFVQVVDGPQLYIEEIPDLPVTIRIVADTVELQVGIAQARFGREGWACDKLAANAAPISKCFN